MNAPLDRPSVRARLAGRRGKAFWRTLEELAETEEFREFLRREFPREASAWAEGPSRRRFLALMGASLALAGLTSCGGPPAEPIVPYVRAPEEVVPGKPLYYATACCLNGAAVGVLVETHLGRPTKVEGNPAHPSSLGATDAFAQASLLGLYDPDRSRAVSRAGRIGTWPAFFGVLTEAMKARRAERGAGLRLLTGAVTSPALAREIEELLRDLPEARWHSYEPAGRDNAREGALRAFGEDLECRYRLGAADVILSLDADFLSWGPGRIRYAHDFAARRRVEEGQASMNRLYAVEGALTPTGAAADHRLPLRPSEVEGWARRLAARLAAPEGNGNGEGDAWLAAVARDLSAHRGASLVLAGEAQPPAVHALAHVLNAALGNAGRTVEYTPPLEAPGAGSLRALAEDLAAGRVRTLLILESNPVYDAPADLDFARLLERVPLRARWGLYEDETSAYCHWHVPAAHEFETWGDARAYDGTVTPLQPLIAPLYGGATALEFISAARGRPGRSSYEIVREHWKPRFPPDLFERRWREALHEGLLPETAYAPRAVKLLPGAAEGTPASATGLEVSFRPDPSVWDGRFANNAWLQELPKPLSRLTWDNAAFLGPRTAERLGLKSGDEVVLRRAGRAAEAPVWVSPGHAEGAVTVHLGYGRTRAGRAGDRAGFSAYRLRTSDAPGFAGGLEIQKTGRRRRLASTQHHHLLHGRDIVRAAPREAYARNPAFARDEEPPGRTLYPEVKYEGYAWGMAIDLNACVGCNACVVACQAENNVPVVGREEVLRGREMHWLRIDTYHAGDPANPETYFQPMLCVHCERAPCEVVCPVNATTHSREGLNEMTYNRCVGTRYCSNNCPWKVRRFNFLEYTGGGAAALKLLRNPDVTVRSRGVMEKCTFCVQRISAARIEAKKEDRVLRDGEVVTACQAACPTRAIVFGDLNDPASRVARLKASPLNYAVLGELNTRPRATHLAKVWNPNPELEGR